MLAAMLPWWVGVYVYTYVYIYIYIYVNVAVSMLTTIYNICLKPKKHPGLVVKMSTEVEI